MSKNIKVRVECPDCNGYGEVEHDHGDMVLCEACEGEGSIEVYRRER